MALPKKFFRFNYFPRHKEYIHVYEDEFKTGDGPDIVGTDGVSCCLVITLYDPSTKKGVLSHIMNLRNSPTSCRAENIVDTMLKAIDLAPDSPHLSSLEVTLSGESEPLFLSHPFKAETVRSTLEKYNIPIIGEDLGVLTAECDPPEKDDISSASFILSQKGRLVFLDCETGIVKVYRA